MDIEGLRISLREAGQLHLLSFYDGLPSEEQAKLIESIQNCDFSLLAELHRTLYLEKRPVEVAEISPFPEVTVLEAMTQQQVDIMRDSGLSLIIQGKAAALVMAAGTGTRLGFEYPKGMYDINLISHKTIFQLQAEKLLTLERLGRDFASREVPPIPWLIMTNQETHDTIVSFFRDNDHFGLNSDQCFFFQQGMLPSVDFHGKVILDAPGKLSLSPNGNGGVFQALSTTGALDWLEDRGVDYVHLFSVDNVLVKVCDPVFLGFTAMHNYQVTSKTVPKVSHDEAIGVIVLHREGSGVLEYSEIPKDLAKATDEAGNLRLNTGSICNHVFSSKFLRAITTQHIADLNRQYHLAVKKIPFIDVSGTRVVPTEPNGLKFELFYFDVLKFAQKTGVLQVKREQEFAPVKNAPGGSVDSPDTARQLIGELHKSWLVKAGATFQDEAASSDLRVEISPLISYEGEGLETFAGQTLNFPVYIYY